MSSLNLTPDVVVIGAQAGIFLTNMWIVNKLMLTPYLELRAKRDGSTSGSEEEAQSLLTKAKEMDQTIAEKLRDAHRDASVVRQKIKDDAMAVRAKKLEQAEGQAKKIQVDMQDQIRANLAEESGKKSTTIAQVRQELVQASIGAPS